MSVDAIMTTKVATCTTGDSTERAAKLMWDYDCGAIPVLDDGGLVAGMITDRDICMAALTQGRPLAEIPLTLAMSSDAFVLHAGESVASAARIMRERKVRRLPIVDDGGKVVGLLSINDLARAAAHAPTDAEISESLVARTLAGVCEPGEAPATAAE